VTEGREKLVAAIVTGILTAAAGFATGVYGDPTGAEGECKGYADALEAQREILLFVIETQQAKSEGE
jgi:hypothetical protein